MQKRALSPLGERLQGLRTMAGLGGRELDRLAETHASLIESGHADNPTFKTVGKIAQVFGVTLDWLVYGNGKPPTARSVQAAVGEARARKAAKPDESGEHAAVPRRSAG